MIGEMISQATRTRPGVTAIVDEDRRVPGHDVEVVVAEI